MQGPFIYNLYENVFNSSPSHPYEEKIEALRDTLKSSTQYISTGHFGAGSQVNPNTRRKVSSIAKYGLTKKKYSLILSKLIDYLEATHLVELGTSLGINTLYMAKGEMVNVSTFEGSEALLSIARDNFQHMGKHNISLIPGDIDETLPRYLEQAKLVDLAFVDANHTYKSTLGYFNILLTHSHHNTCLIFDDIYWSEEMSKAWQAIHQDPRVTLSIDIYQMGLVFINPALSKQHYTLDI